MVYNGPCEACTKLIGTPRWPQVLPHEASIVWMRDFLRHDKDEYKQYVPDPHKNKERNPLTGKMKIRNIRNPKWEKGYKEGDYCGPGFLTVRHDEPHLKYLLSDVIRICSAMRAGMFYRAESKECFMCDYKQQCLDKLEAAEPDLVELANNFNAEPDF
jgi:hypothetical protein